MVAEIHYVWYFNEPSRNSPLPSGCHPAWHLRLSWFWVRLAFFFFFFFFLSVCLVLFTCVSCLILCMSKSIKGTLKRPNSTHTGVRKTETTDRNWPKSNPSHRSEADRPCVDLWISILILGKLLFHFWLSNCFFADLGLHFWFRLCCFDWLIVCGFGSLINCNLLMKTCKQPFELSCQFTVIFPHHKSDIAK